MDTHSYPYADVVRGLVASTMRAQRAFLLESVANGSSDAVGHGRINRHFSWLAVKYPTGINRHLFDATARQFPLRTAALMNRAGGAAVPPEVQDRLERMEPPDIEGEANLDATNYVRDEPTRISNLIKNAFKDAGPSKANQKGLLLSSPLSIVYDFLTVPDMPGTRAYALVALRNFLFEEFSIVPNLHSDVGAVFAVGDIEETLSSIWTSLRPRHYSSGEDKLPEGKGVGALVRHFLAMKGVLQQRFRTHDLALEYLASGCLKQARSDRFFEFSKSPFFEKLPEAGELINELFGLPLPIRGGETVFKGGLKFSNRQGLVVALHGGPGTGKTALALALCAYIAPFGISTLFLTPEENPQDLKDRLASLVPDTIRRLSFYPAGGALKHIQFEKIPLTHNDGGDLINTIEKAIHKLKSALAKSADGEGGFQIPKPCRAVVVLDGLHDLFATMAPKQQDLALRQASYIHRLYQFIEELKELKALVILTMGEGWSGEGAVDYLVDVAMHLSHDLTSEYGAKPERRLSLSKARHQLCANGSHGFRIAGIKGVRFSPQINYQLDKRAAWRSRLPDKTIFKTVLIRVAKDNNTASRHLKKTDFEDNADSVEIYAGSHIFVNGSGSGGKAALALKIAIAPSFSKTEDGSLVRIENDENVLVVSFLYPEDYYLDIMTKLTKLQAVEYGKANSVAPRVHVFQLYPGSLKPDDLYNRIEWELEAAELRGDPYTCVIIEGIHNVFLQFPAIEKYRIFWPQIYNALRSRPIMTITTHTTLLAPQPASGQGPALSVDDNRSEPLRHALVQKTDFQFEVDPLADQDPPLPGWTSGLFALKTLAAINQPIPKRPILWSRESMTLIKTPVLVEQ